MSLSFTLATGYREWMEEAICKQYPADFWHSDDQQDTWQAKRICKQECPVAAQCLRHALNEGEAEGVWGGLSARERRQLASGEPLPRMSPTCRKNHPDEESDEVPRPNGAPRCRACERAYTRNRRNAA